MSSQIEGNIIHYLRYIVDNHYFYCKYFFEVNLEDEQINLMKLKKASTVNQEQKSHKLLSEITLDIIFFMLEKKQTYDLISLLGHFFEKNHSKFYEIDEYYLLMQNNTATRESSNDLNQQYKSSIINLLNSQKVIAYYWDCINMPNILNCFYFLIHFIYKYKSCSTLKNEQMKELNNILNKA